MLLEFNYMVSELNKDNLKTQTGATGKELTLDEIERIIGLIRKGNPGSLAKARSIVGIETGEFSILMGISDNLLIAWETEKESPSQKSLITWRLKLGDFIEGKIASYLRTDDPELIHQFWEIMWRLNDL
jgi:DNA-binding transcriptional regulator YiaG